MLSTHHKSQCFYLLVNFTKFQAEKYDFQLYEGFFMKRMNEIHQILKLFFKSSNFYDKLHSKAKNME